MSEGRMTDDEIKREARRLVDLVDAPGYDHACVPCPIDLFKALVDLAGRPHD